MNPSVCSNPARLRADRLLVERGLFESRASAQAAIAAGLVTADGGPVRRASDTLPVTARIEAEAPHPYVSRGGVKLAAALDAFAIDPAGLVCLDVGASTGGFTDVLLRRGARRVHAIDVGRGQLHPRLAADPRVDAREAVDVRRLDPLPEAPALAVIDVSFISLKLVLPSVLALVAPACTVVALVKPQFEVGRAGLGRGGIVRDAALREAARDDLLAFMQSLDLAALGVIPSPIAGGDGNAEFLIGARRDG